MDFWRRTNWKIASMGRVWYSISAVVIVASLIAWGTQGLNYGLDFTGGTLYKYSLERPITSGQEAGLIAQTRAALAAQEVTSSQIQVAGGNLLLIRTQTKEHQAAAEESEGLLAVLNEKLGPTVGTISATGLDVVGPVVGEQLRKAAILALIIGNLLVLIYLTVRYEFRIAVACIVGLVHDVLVMVGIMALARAELNSEFVAAMLTIVGYSVNDSVVIFDRMRENRRLHRSSDLETVANASLLQTMSRSVNTVLTVLFTLLALFLLGGPTIHSFMLALLAGMVSGMYSSIFIASSMVVSWDKWSQRRRGKIPTPGQRRAVVTAGMPAPSEPTTASEPREAPSVSAEQAMRRAQNEAQEEKREARRERRKAKSGGKGKRRH